MPTLKDRAHLYRTLATFEGAGVPRSRALEHAHRGAFRRACAEMATLISRHGMSLHEAMAVRRGLFSPFEINLVAVGEQTGRLEQVCASLAEWFELIRRLRSQVISGLFYPAIQYHVAALLIPAISYFMQEISDTQALFRVGVLLAVPYTLAFFLIVVRPILFRRGLRLPVWAGAILLNIPLIGGLVHKLNCTRFFRAFSLSLQAGVNVVDAVALSAASCTNSLLRLRFMRIAETIQRQGCSFADAYQTHMGSSHRNSMILELMQTGEEAGAGDEMAGRIARICGEEVEAALSRIAKIVPVFVYLALALYIGYQIIRFYGKLFEQINSLL